MVLQCRSILSRTHVLLRITKHFRPPSRTATSWEAETSSVNFDPKNRPHADLDDNIRSKLLEGKRIGRANLRCRKMPERITHAVQEMIKKDESIGKASVPHYLEAGFKLRRHISGRHPPLEEKVKEIRIKDARQKIEKEYEDILHNDDLSTNQLEVIDHEINQRAEEFVMKRSYRWKPIVYDKDAAYAYLLTKSPFDYACTMEVLKEIKKLDPEFRPKTFFDYGSGVGSAVWAVNDTFGQMNEIFCVDTSPDMNDLAKTILMDGDSEAQLPAGIFFRLHLPASNDLMYDLTTSAFTLLDMPSAEARLNAVDNLWRKASPYLVLIEEGTNAGFQVLAEARDYLIQLNKVKYFKDEEFKEVQGHVFAPCPHEKLCPRYFNDVIPCNFDVKYQLFPMKSIPSSVRETSYQGRFSYLVFKKGPSKSQETCFPRLVAQPMKRNNHIVCRMCTNRGKLEEFVAVKRRSKSEERLLYNHAKSVHVGNQFRVHLSDKKEESE